MRFGIHAVGSEGDIRPLIALGGGLRRAGHEVTVAAHPSTAFDYEGLCRRLDLTYAPPPFVPEFDHQRLSATDGTTWANELSNQFWKTRGHEDMVHEVAMSLCRTHDVVISHYLSYPTKAAALLTGANHVAVQLTHEHTPTKHRPPLAHMPNFGIRLNELAWEQLRELHDWSGRQMIDGFWARHGLPRFHRMTDLYFSDRLNLLAVSPTLCETQPDWGDRHVVTGVLEIAAEEPPLDAALDEFIAAGPPPVFMGFGSTQHIYPGSEMGRNVALLTEAAVASGHRAVIQVPDQIGPRYVVNSVLPDHPNLFLVSRVPYGRMFARSAAAVHHGGAGTLHLAMRSGCPSLVVAFTGHHYHLAFEAHRAGVALRPVWRHEVTPALLASHIRQLVDERAWRQRALAIAPVVRQEDGVAKAVDIINARVAAPGMAAAL